MATKVFWMRFDAGEGDVSDAFRVKLDTKKVDFKTASVEDLKEQLLAQVPAVFDGVVPEGKQLALAWVYLFLAPAPAGRGDKDKDRKKEGKDQSPAAASAPGSGEDALTPLSGSDALSKLPSGAGSPEWHFIIRVKVPGVQRVARAAEPEEEEEEEEDDEPETLYEKGLVDESEPEHIKNAMNLSELYPGGTIPGMRGKGDSDIVKGLKVLFVFAIYIVFAAGLMYFLGEIVPKIVPPEYFPMSPASEGKGEHWRSALLRTPGEGGSAGAGEAKTEL